MLYNNKVPQGVVAPSVKNNVRKPDNDENEVLAPRTPYGSFRCYLPPEVLKRMRPPSAIE